MGSKALLRSWQAVFRAGVSTYFLLRALRWEQWARRQSSSQAGRVGAVDWMAAAKASELIVHWQCGSGKRACTYIPFPRPSPKPPGGDQMEGGHVGGKWCSRWAQLGVQALGAQEEVIGFVLPSWGRRHGNMQNGFGRQASDFQGLLVHVGAIVL